MAHFARIENGTVMAVVVVDNTVTSDADGNEVEAIGVAFLQTLYGIETEWAQTSYNAHLNGFRGKYAAIGDSFDGENFTTPTVSENP